MCSYYVIGNGAKATEHNKKIQSHRDVRNCREFFKYKHCRECALYYKDRQFYHEYWEQIDKQEEEEAQRKAAEEKIAQQVDDNYYGEPF